MERFFNEHRHPGGDHLGRGLEMEGGRVRDEDEIWSTLKALLEGGVTGTECSSSRYRPRLRKHKMSRTPSRRERSTWRRPTEPRPQTRTRIATALAGFEG